MNTKKAVNEILTKIEKTIKKNKAHKADLVFILENAICQDDEALIKINEIKEDL
jgi:hypothetical protein